MRRTIGRWWLLFGGAALVAVTIVGFQAFRGSTLTRQDMAAHLTFPATYNGREDVFTGAGFTLREDGTATLDGISLGTEEHDGDNGRRCLGGEMVSATGAARWWADDSGWVIIEADSRRSRFHQDDPLLMAEGWGKVYLLTPCDEEFTATFVTLDARYSG